MSRGKYLGLPGARKKKKFDRFAKEQPSESKLDRLIEAFARTPESIDQTH
jgi:hypothetical protein